MSFDRTIKMTAYLLPLSSIVLFISHFVSSYFFYFMAAITFIDALFLLYLIVKAS